MLGASVADKNSSEQLSLGSHLSLVPVSIFSTGVNPERGGVRADRRTSLTAYYSPENPPTFSHRSLLYCQETQTQRLSNASKTFSSMAWWLYRRESPCRKRRLPNLILLVLVLYVPTPFRSQSVHLIQSVHSDGTKNASFLSSFQRPLAANSSASDSLDSCD